MPEIIEYRITAEMELLQTNTDKSPSPQSKSTPAQTTKKLANEASNEASGSVSKLVAIQMGKQALQYGMSNYGNLTGDYVGQANISAGLQVAGLVAMASQGPLGIAAAVTSLGIQAANYGIDMAKKRRETEFLRERTGMTQNSGGRR